MCTAEELKSKGNQAFAKKEFKKAAKIYRDAIKLDSTNPVLYSNRAICFIKLKDWQRAIDDCITGLQIENIDNKTKVKLYWRYSTALIETDNLSKASDFLNEALKLDPNNQVIKLDKENVEDKLYIRSKKRKREDSGVVSYEDVPVEIVDELPPEFQEQQIISITNAAPITIGTNDQMHTDDELEKELAKIEGVIIPKKKHQLKSTPTAVKNERWADSQKYPEKPTVYFLSSLSIRSDKRDFYEYVLNIEPSYYKSIFELAGIDTDFLSFYIESASEYLSQYQNQDFLLNIASCLKLFPSLPRFTIASMFLPSSQVKELIGKVETLSSCSLKFLWK